MPPKGFIKIRRGIEQHLIEGNISLLEFGVYVIIHLQADFETGIWWGSAPKIVALSPRDITLRHVVTALRNIEEKAYIKRFRVQGSRGNYPVLIDKYEPQFGVLRGYRLNANESNDWRHPKYDVCSEDVSDVEVTRKSRGSETVSEAVPIPELRTRSKITEREQSQIQSQKPPAKPAGAPQRRSESEQRRIIQSRDARLQKEYEVQKELRVGAGPELTEAIRDLARKKSL